MGWSERRDGLSPLAVIIGLWPGAQLVRLSDGRYVPDGFDAEFPGASIGVRVLDGRPAVVRLELGDGDDVELTTSTLRSVKLHTMLREAVQCASEMGAARRARFREAEMADAAQPVKRSDGRKLTDAAVRKFVAAYRGTTGSMAERGKELGYSRGSVHRLLTEAVKRGIVSADERGEL